MAARPARFSFTVRPATVSDTEFLLRLVASTRPELLQLGLAPEQIQGLVRMQLTAQEQEYRNSYPCSTHGIVMRSGEPAGRLWVARLPHEIRVVDIGLLPQFQRGGIGTALYQDLQAEAQTTGRPLRCSVFRFNEPSLRFHQALGFQTISQSEVMLDLEWRPAGAS